MWVSLQHAAVEESSSIPLKRNTPLPGENWMPSPPPPPNTMEWLLKYCVAGLMKFALCFQSCVFKIPLCSPVQNCYHPYLVLTLNALIFCVSSIVTSCRLAYHRKWGQLSIFQHAEGVTNGIGQIKLCCWRFIALNSLFMMLHFCREKFLFW